MKCPMMGMMGTMPNTPMAEMMKGMSERMGGMFGYASAQQGGADEGRRDEVSRGER